MSGFSTNPSIRALTRGRTPTRGGALTSLAPLLAALAVGCSSVANDGAPADFGAADADPAVEPYGGSGDDDNGGTGDQGGDSSGGDPEPDSDGTGTPPPSDDDGTFPGCPEPLPGGWVFCEDFETITDPSEVMLDYQARDGAFVLVDSIGASGTHAMEVDYRVGEEGAGWMVLSFGDSPINNGERPSYAPEGHFAEIYWRLRVKTEPGWPDLGPGQLTRTISFASPDWSEAVVAHLRSAGSDVVVEGVPVTCVTGSEVTCAGFDDTNGLESLGSMIGDTPLFSESMSGQWHCVEGHLMLNNPGKADGQFEFWVDDQLQASRRDLDLRGTWVEYGINAVVVENLWPGGAPKALRRWIDDLVVSTEPIGCEGAPI